MIEGLHYGIYDNTPEGHAAVIDDVNSMLATLDFNVKDVLAVGVQRIYEEVKCSSIA